MEQFAFSFAITMVHSIWQMALLLLLYYVLTSIFSKWPPLAKRNLSLLIIVAQLLTSVVSFFIIYSDHFLQYRENIPGFLLNFLSSQTWLQQYASYIFIIYLFIFSFKISRSGVGWLKFKQGHHNNLAKASVEIRLFTNAKAAHFGIRHKVQIWCSETIISPITYGFFKPVILLPVALINQLNMEQTESLIVHELTHIKHNDYIFNWLLLVTEAMFFFNPFVKIAGQNIRIEREKNCDLQVLHFNYPAIPYAETLLRIAQQQRSNHAAFSISAVNKKTALLDRIRYFSDNNNLSKQQTRYFSLASLVIWGFVLLNLFLAGIFIQKTDTSNNSINTTFAALPVNEWNKAFATKAAEPFEEIAPIPSEFIAGEDQKNEEVFHINENEKHLSTPVVVAEPISVAETQPGVQLTDVSLEEADPQHVKEIVINEEHSGITITKAYRMTEVNGIWKMEPLWMISEVKLTDSLKQVIKLDSSIISIIPTVQ